MATIRNVALTALVLALAACSPAMNATPENGGGDTDGSASCPDTIAIREFDFEPATCSVQGGTTLTFVNEDDVAHTATAGPDAASSFDTGVLEPGESATVTFDVQGPHPYHCELHSSMQATIHVAGDTAAEGAAAEAGDDGNGDGARY